MRDLLVIGYSHCGLIPAQRQKVALAMHSALPGEQFLAKPTADDIALVCPRLSQVTAYTLRSFQHQVANTDLLKHEAYQEGLYNTRVSVADLFDQSPYGLRESLGGHFDRCQQEAIEFTTAYDHARLQLIDG